MFFTYTAHCLSIEPTERAAPLSSLTTCMSKSTQQARARVLYRCVNLGGEIMIILAKVAVNIVNPAELNHLTTSAKGTKA